MVFFNGRVSAQRKLAPGVVVIQQRQRDLLQVVRTGGPPRCLAGGLNGGQQQGYQNANDRDHDKQFYECETASCMSATRRCSPQAEPGPAITRLGRSGGHYILTDCRLLIVHGVSLEPF
jgi:hypothetical protein